jgi:hypothetical protein
MIVKNEAQVIERCLASVKPLIDTWLIVDTGSTDGTQNLIRTFLKDIPGELHDRPWVDFGHNRTEAIRLAQGKASYLLVIDADDVLMAPPDFSWPLLTADAYSIEVHYNTTRFWRTHLFRSDLDFYYAGVIHEGLMSSQKQTHERLEKITYHCLGGGARSQDPKKYERDAMILQNALSAEPGNTRYAFYLAQSFRDAGKWAQSILAYENRVNMQGWDEEVYFSLHQIAVLSVKLNLPDELVIQRFLRAYEFRPTRAEPLCHLAAFLRKRGRPAAAYPFALTASRLPRPSDTLFVEEAVYVWCAMDEYAVAAYWVGDYEAGISANQHLLSHPLLPESQRERIEKNLRFCQEKCLTVC